MNLQKTLALTIMGALILAACGNGATGAPTPGTGPNANGTTTTGVGNGTPGAGAETRSAVISELQNDVDARQASAVDWLAAIEGDQITAGGGVRTGDESRVRIATSDGSIIRIAANTEFQLAEFSPQPTDPVTRLSIEAGKVWIQVTKALGGGSFEVETPSGVATVRGSLMSVEYDPAVGRVLVTCAEGECELRDRLGQNAVRLLAGEQSEIPGSDQGPLAARRMRRQQVREWLDNFPEARAILQRLLDQLPEDETPTPAAPSGTGGTGQTACDHAYFPMRAGATWTYQTSEGNTTWTIESVTGDANSATAVMLFQTSDLTGTYNWQCDANGLVSFDFGRLDMSQLGAVSEFSVANASGAWMPAADLLTVGYSWNNAYDLTIQIALPDNAGAMQGALSQSSTSTVTGADPVTVDALTVDGLQISQSSNNVFSFSLGTVSSPGQASLTTSTMSLARGIGMVSSTTTSEGFTSASTLVSYSIP